MFSPSMYNKNEVLLSNAKIPLVLGVTGHRDVREDDKVIIQKELEIFFSTLRKDYPNTPLYLISALAEGADRIAARSALDNGLSLISHIPMKVEDYKKDFPFSEKDFYDLLEKSKYFIPPFYKINTEDNIQENGCQRNLQYANAGFYIANRCHILIALWDGKSVNKIGGTSHIVNYKLNNNDKLNEYNAKIKKCKSLSDFERRFFSNEFNLGPVYHILIMRGNEDDTSKNGEVNKKYQPESKYLYPNPNTFNKSYYEKIYKDIDNFNKNYTEFIKDYSKNVEKSRQQILSELPEDKKANLDWVEENLIDKYAVSDSISIKYKKQYLFTSKLLYSLSVITVLALVLSDFIRNLFLLILIMLTFFMTMIIYEWQESKKFDNLFLDNRLFAETIRIRLFLYFNGI
ncbi:MAG: hypothetical protein M1478_08805, partial [Deltaproteobacteria bacterium]|nr:hypothetical protein [Deltaproteobacteria bacterium]